MNSDIFCVWITLPLTSYGIIFWQNVLFQPEDQWSWERSPEAWSWSIKSSWNDLDLEYSHTFIEFISCLHLQRFRSQAAIVSKPSDFWENYNFNFYIQMTFGQGQEMTLAFINYLPSLTPSVVCI